METFVDINKYMLNSRESRREHLRLEESCIEIGGDSRTCRGLLAHFLQTTIGDRSVYVCHACYNAKCSNPRHLYWGSPCDNVLDTKESGRWKSFYALLVEKYGLNEAHAMLKIAGSAGGKAGGGHNQLTVDEIQSWRNAIISVDTSKHGFIGKIAKQMNRSHTQARRILCKYFPDIQTFKRKEKNSD